MSDQEPEGPSGPPKYPGNAPPSYPGSPPPPGQGAPQADPWYAPPAQPGAYYPPGSPPPGQWGPGSGYGPPGGYGSPAGYGPPQGYPGAAAYAGYWARVGGAVLDTIIISIASLVYLLPAHAFRTTHVLVNGRDTLHFNLGGAGLVLLLVLGALYSGLMIGLRGQTLGMMAARVKAVDGTTGGLIGFWRAVGRDLFERVLGALFLIPLIIDLLFPVWDPRRQTLHDKATNTVVIRA
jgi:uncharacterized RDD family membrane protein YckC